MTSKVLPIVAALALLAAAAPATAAEVGASGKCQRKSGGGGGFDLTDRSTTDPQDALRPGSPGAVLSFLDGVTGFASAYATHVATLDAAALEDGEASTDACNHPDSRDGDREGYEEHPDYVEAHASSGSTYVQVCLHNGANPDQPDAGDVTVVTDPGTGCPEDPVMPSNGIRMP